MDPYEQMNRKRDAQRRLHAQRRRVSILRSRVLAISLICFALLWAVVFVQMATGNDPVLGAGRHVAGATAVRPAENKTDSEEAGGAGAAAAATIETTSPDEEREVEAIEPESVETEVIETEPEPEFVPEPEPEPAPVETAQS
jgi:outer membrane biosynthesis protein TonB